MTGRGSSMVTTRRVSISIPRKTKPKESAKYSLGESLPIKGIYAMLSYPTQWVCRSEERKKGMGGHQDTDHKGRHSTVTPHVRSKTRETPNAFISMVKVRDHAHHQYRPATSPLMSSNSPQGIRQIYGLPHPPSNPQHLSPLYQWSSLSCAPRQTIACTAVPRIK